MDLVISLSKLFLGISFFYSVLSVFQLIRKNHLSGYLIVLPIIYLFYVIPLFTDWLFNLQFDSYWYIKQALQDSSTQVIYNFYIGAFVLVFTFLARYKRSFGEDNYFLSGFSLIRIYNKYKLIIWLIIVSPLLAVFISGNPSYYLTYSIFKSDMEAPPLHILVTKFCFLGVLFSALVISVLGLKEKEKLTGSNLPLRVLLYFFTFSAIWIHGKRSIVAIFFAALFIMFFITKLYNGKRILKRLVLFVFFFIGFNSFYGKNISNDFSETYKRLRMDYSRDYSVKFSIYNDLIIERNILPNQFDSYIFNVLQFVPRSYWEEKPYPYAVYFTNAVFGDFGSYHLYGWGFTTNIIAEAISNLGSFGFLIAPLIIIIILHFESKSRNAIFKLLSIVIAVLLFVLQPASFAIIIVFYMILFLKKQYR
ncbi:MULTISPECIES: hypothetical protein [Salegentibacter]|uniref:Oligosaccharide repeat unit polymerase n=1 Tax=Salegentibacter maritimus TaxID=2794347 RepID=A0ABS0TEX1_9FLAO|nr:MULTISPECIES: hypothetical protein [Salegentibacter]MBE7640933.1 hypothetical protein [Salegentibacter sp. BLCTC]MBI6115948.1 hypothetical protein [Salegentibacter maritimus]MBI6119537.1 hypothetical protein [Salegentibacter maritimus]